MNIAIFGGSFDPAHRGHYEIVRQALKLADIDKVIVVPARRNPLKDNLPILSEETRRRILEETFRGMEGAEISSFELERDATSYTYETLSHFKEQRPDDKFHLLLGEDAFALFHLWAEIELILKLSEVLVFPRPGSRRDHPGVFHYNDSKRVKWIDIEIPDISSTRIRRSHFFAVEENFWMRGEPLNIWKKHLMETERETGRSI